jgi:hypothetical protein
MISVHLQYTKSQRAFCPIEGCKELLRVTSTFRLALKREALRRNLASFKLSLRFWGYPI